MKLHKEGIIPITVALCLFALCLYLYFRFVTLPFYVDFFVVVALTVAPFMTVRFFRVPRRLPNLLENAVISPADGTVIAIEEREETEFFKDKRIKISIFMSVHNVHVNFYPIAGTIDYVAYHPGKYFIAHLPKSSCDNEHNTVVVSKDDGTQVLFRQIAGFVARRIVSYPRVGDQVEQAAEMGMIRFGSRVDVFLPLESEVNVHIGDKVRTQKSVLAYL